MRIRIEHMFETMDGLAVLEAAEAAHRARRWAENDELILATRWADLNPAESIHPDGLAVEGGPRGVRPGGDGTPEVCDLSIAEFGSRLGKGPMAAAIFVGRALDMRHRLPLLWTKIISYEVIGWQGCQVARLTHDLTMDQARWVDQRIARFAGVVPWPKLRDLTEAAIVRVDADRIEEQAAERRGKRGVWLTQTDDDGLKGIYGKLDPLSANRLYATIQEIADCLPADTGSADERRAEAMGMLGQELQTTRLRAERRQPDLFDHELAEAAAPAPGEDPDEVLEESDVHPLLRDRPALADFDAAVFAAAVKRMLEKLDPATLIPTATMVVHLAAESIETDRGVARIEDVGPATVGSVKRWLGHHQVRLQTVIDLNDPPPPVDCHEISGRHRRHVLLCQPASTFPWSTATRGLDLDHVRPYLPIMRGGPPGQTSVTALTPLSRIEHRLVTHGGWRRRQPEPGTMIFRSPHGYVQLTNHSVTHDLGRGTFAAAVWDAARPREDRQGLSQAG